MPRNRKYFAHGSVILITTRVEHGLPMPPTHLMNYVIWGNLCKAKRMYKIKVCHFVFMSNHLHMIIVVDCPQDVSKFVGYIKSETSHAVNILLGRRQRTVWQEGYDSPSLLTPKDVLYYIRYIYLNPTRAGLVPDINEYPGVSSWEMFCSGRHTVKHKRAERIHLFKLPVPALGVNEQKRIVAVLSEQPGSVNEFDLEPFAWVDSFPQLEGIDLEDLKQQLLQDIAREHRELREERAKSKRRFIGATDLRRQSMLMEWEPKKFSNRMICICSDRALKLLYLETFKALAEQARIVYQKWKLGEFSYKIPPGMLAPRVPELASALSIV